ncbi:sulfotransferase [Nostocoides japonicum]|uniref:sulfotransferase n=1 Tax=Nostocoides japonicum TaxID=99481 RepID=UPI00138F835A|nr:sulfotransferase [Tetrasphaera japonica]
MSDTPEDKAIVNAYRALSDILDGATIVDSSKLPPYGLLLDGRPELEVRILHVVRDPRATAFSWQRSKPTHDLGNDELMPKLQVWKSSALWALWNVLTLLVWGRSDRYLRVRYEDFVADPEPTMRAIAEHCGFSDASLPFVDPTTVTLAPTHSVAGNPARHSRGEIRIRPDDEWTRAMSRSARWTVTTITAPALLLFGYTRPSRRKGERVRTPSTLETGPAATHTTNS